MSGTEGWNIKDKPFRDYKKIDAKIKDDFLNKNQDSSALRYQNLFEYFAGGFIKYRSKNGAFAYYPGARSSHGRNIDGLEGFARFFPLAAAYINSKNGGNVKIEDKNYNLIELLSAGLIAGTNSKNEEYWGEIQDLDQRIVEAADVALGLWISRKYIWNKLELNTQQQIATWLKEAISKKIYDNNWCLFPIIIQKSLEALKISNIKHSQAIEKLYQDYKKRNYIGEGWFNDPPKGVDYYNAWAIHYSLFWIDQMDPNFDPVFIRKSHSEFLKFYRYFFSKNGFPAMGRSLCYRMAAPAPMISGSLLVPNEISAGFAFRALDVTWRFFVNQNSLQKGTATQGLFKTDLSILNFYSGPSSSLWSLRSLIMAFYVAEFIPLWSSPSEKLPVEIANFSQVNNATEWCISGDLATQNIKLEILKNQNKKPTKFRKYGIINRIIELITKTPCRPDNYEALYKQAKYSTNDPISKK